VSNTASFSGWSAPSSFDNSVDVCKKRSLKTWARFSSVYITWVRNLIPLDTLRFQSKRGRCVPASPSAKCAK
jgi:hypothetical protein